MIYLVYLLVLSGENGLLCLGDYVHQLILRFSLIFCIFSGDCCRFVVSADITVARALQTTLFRKVIERYGTLPPISRW